MYITFIIAGTHIVPKVVIISWHFIFDVSVHI